MYERRDAMQNALIERPLVNAGQVAFDKEHNIDEATALAQVRKNVRRLLNVSEGDLTIDSNPPTAG
jgi:hypothetical protein